MKLTVVVTYKGKKKSTYDVEVADDATLSDLKEAVREAASIETWGQETHTILFSGVKLDEVDGKKLVEYEGRDGKTIKDGNGLVLMRRPEGGSKWYKFKVHSSTRNIDVTIPSGESYLDLKKRIACAYLVPAGDAAKIRLATSAKARPGEPLSKVRRQTPVEAADNELMKHVGVFRGSARGLVVHFQNLSDLVEDVGRHTGSINERVAELLEADSPAIDRVYGVVAKLLANLDHPNGRKYRKFDIHKFRKAAGTRSQTGIQLLGFLGWVVRGDSMELREDARARYSEYLMETLHKRDPERFAVVDPDPPPKPKTKKRVSKYDNTPVTLPTNPEELQKHQVGRGFGTVLME